MERHSISFKNMDLSMNMFGSRSTASTLTILSGWSIPQIFGKITTLNCKEAYGWYFPLFFLCPGSLFIILLNIISEVPTVTVQDAAWWTVSLTYSIFPHLLYIFFKSCISPVPPLPKCFRLVGLLTPLKIEEISPLLT